MSKVPESIRQELAALADKPESEIDFSDLPPPHDHPGLEWCGTWEVLSPCQAAIDGAR